MSVKAEFICLQNIDTYFLEDYKSDNDAQRIIEAENSTKNRIISLVAEKTELGQIILLEKFQYFAALKKNNSNLRIPCLIYPCTSEKKRLLHILKVNIPLEKDIGWLFYNKHIMILVKEHNMSIEEIATLVNQGNTKIKGYTLDERIPPHIRDRTIEMGARTVVQSLCSNTIIPPNIKTILYENAILDKGHTYRLTVEKFKHFKMLCTKNNIPVSLLCNKSRRELFINELLSNNFYLDKHFNTLMPTNYPTNYKLFITKYGLSPKKDTEQLILYDFRWLLNYDRHNSQIRFKTKVQISLHRPLTATPKKPSSRIKIVYWGVWII